MKEVAKMEKTLKMMKTYQKKEKQQNEDTLRKMTRQLQRH